MLFAAKTSFTVAVTIKGNFVGSVGFLYKFWVDLLCFCQIASSESLKCFSRVTHDGDLFPARENWYEPP